MSKEIRELLSVYMDLNELIFQIVSEGVYEKKEKEVLLGAFHASMKYGVTPKSVTDLGAVSKAVLGNFLAGGNPKLNNFIVIVGDLRSVIGSILIENGVLRSISQEMIGTTWTRLQKYTELGRVYALADALEAFQSEFQSCNSLDGKIDDVFRGDLIELLEQIVVQLKNGTADMGLLRLAKKKIAEVSTWSAGKMIGKSLEKFGELAVAKLMGF